MKRCLTVLFCIVQLCMVSGCFDGGKRPEAPSKGAFPQSMVGVWETQKSFVTKRKWGIKFEQDGSVKKIIHNLAGPVNLSEGGKLIEGKTEDDFVLFHMSPCKVQYDPNTEILQVDIIVDDYFVQKPGLRIEGSIRDNFRGRVSKNGRIWETERRSFGRLKGADNPSDEFIETHPDKVTFYKIDLPKSP